MIFTFVQFFIFQFRDLAGVLRIRTSAEQSLPQVIFLTCVSEHGVSSGSMSCVGCQVWSRSGSHKVHSGRPISEKYEYPDTRGHPPVVDLCRNQARTIQCLIAFCKFANIQTCGSIGFLECCSHRQPYLWRPKACLAWLDRPLV